MKKFLFTIQIEGFGPDEETAYSDAKETTDLKRAHYDECIELCTDCNMDIQSCECPKHYIFVCEKCGTKNVGKEAFVGVNDDEFMADNKGHSFYWCFDCEQETRIMSQSDYDEKAKKDIDEMNRDAKADEQYELKRDMRDE